MRKALLRGTAIMGRILKIGVAIIGGGFRGISILMHLGL